MRAALLIESCATAIARELMPAPDVISVRRTEEDAGYVSFRPVVRQNFPLNDLLGLVLSVTGKHPERVRQILRSGSVSLRSYHYSWDGFQPEDLELTALLSRFPDPDPSRPFRPESCTAALVEGGSPHHVLLDLERASLARRRFLRRRSFWDALLDSAAAGPVAYDGYSYRWRADMYRAELSGERTATLAAAAKALAPRDLRRHLRALDRATHLIFVCPREAA